MEESNIFMGEPGLQPSEMANSHLTWEKSDQYDLGLDLEFLNSRIKVRADYYYKHSHDLLMQVPHQVISSSPKTSGQTHLLSPTKVGIRRQCFALSHQRILLGLRAQHLSQLEQIPLFL